VAVLYFENLSPDSADAYLAQGITEEIIDRLGEVRRLVVKSRFAVRRFRGTDGSGTAGLGRELAAAYLVTGSVQRAGNRLRVRAELTRASNGDRVWGQQYERGDGDVFAIMTDIAQHVAAGVAGSVLPTERAALGARPTTNRDAYDHLLRGDLLLGQRTPVSVRQAVVEYEAVTRLDPASTAAWARMAVAYGVLVQRGWTRDGRPADDSLSARGIAAADRAIALDPASSDAWMAEAYAAMLRDPQGWQGAEAGFRRAVALNPRNAEAWHQLGDLLGATGRGAEATAAYGAAVEAEPGRPVSLLSLASGLTPREALAVCDSVLVVDPLSSNAYSFRGHLRIRIGDTTGARADLTALERVTPLGAELGTRALAARLALAIGDSADARSRVRALLHDLPAEGPLHPRIAGLVASVLYDLGDHDAAYDLLRRAPRGVATWQARGLSPWLGDERIQRVLEASRPPWATVAR
jgi:TolB-like protein